MPRNKTYYFGVQAAPSNDDTELIEVPLRYIPFILEALHARMTTAVFLPGDDYATAYNIISRLQWELLMGTSTDRIVSEIRALRAGDVTPVGDRDPALNPYTLVLPTLGQIDERLVLPDGTNVANLLEQIRALLEQQGVNSEDVENILGQILLLLSA